MHHYEQYVYNSIELYTAKNITNFYGRIFRMYVIMEQQTWRGEVEKAMDERMCIM